MAGKSQNLRWHAEADFATLEPYEGGEVADIVPIYTVQRATCQGVIKANPSAIQQMFVNVVGQLVTRLSDGAKSYSGQIYLNGWFGTFGTVVYITAMERVEFSPTPVIVNGVAYKTCRIVTKPVYYNYQNYPAPPVRELGQLTAMLYLPVFPTPANARGLISVDGKVLVTNGEEKPSGFHIPMTPLVSGATTIP